MNGLESSEHECVSFAQKIPPGEKSLGNLRPHSRTNGRNVPCLGLRTCVFLDRYCEYTGTRRCSGNGHLTSRDRHACVAGSSTPRASRSPRRTSAGCPSPGPGRGRATSSATTTSRPPARGPGPILETSQTTNPVRRWGNRTSNWSPSKKYEQKSWGFVENWKWPALHLRRNLPLSTPFGRMLSVRALRRDRAEVCPRDEW